MNKMLTFTRIESLTEVNFDKLLEDSLGSMDSGTYIWAEEIDTVDKKKQHIRNIISSLVNPFMYKVVDESGQDLSLVVGSLKNKALTIVSSLVGYNSNISKSWIYYPKNTQARLNFYKEQGISSVEFNHLTSSNFGTKVPLLLGTGWQSRVYPTENNVGPVSIDFFKSDKIS